ncbi:homoserine dehydrogenase [Roseospira marina]|uniref:Homoserine dehydrogenase n=1 Tax=Roseospira marina TaxID=140057 RepID=A0A5M6IGG2_9PROT|nr:homoserine dehydrogenase [Roseospira marina]KAA5607242.1 homoserine dehydrogenase [Roseospira marina]MBB4312606.1 homoserine dehydrogenase [Roseospira marina]MBB5085378.1 homoserine dehydrogenase [Roseospira marina]
MGAPLRIAIAGLGTVGVGTVQLLQEHAQTIAMRCGRPVEVTAVSARDRCKNRGCDVSGAVWYDDPVAMAREAEADVIVELIGGSDGVARDMVAAALKAGRDVVTANKALLAIHGTELARAAEASNVHLTYEAAVAGGIPIVKALREGLGGNHIRRVYGILNGTCNYILTTMEDTGRDFDDVLEEAQELGYAEADPSFDVDGIDTGHKLALLTSMAFGCPVDFEAVSMEGIRHVTAMDIQHADELGYRIKLLGVAEETEHGILQRVHPCMVPKNGPIASVEGVFNAVVVEGDFVGRSKLEGRGAGAGPTASAVVADIMDLAAKRGAPTFGVPVDGLVERPTATIDTHVGAYYVRLMVLDRPGVFAEIAAALRDAQVSMESILQRGHDPGAVVTVVMTLHSTVEAATTRALERIGGIDAVVEPPCMIRIEDL